MSHIILISSCVAYMPIMMGGVSVYSAVYSYLAMQGPGTNNRFVPSDIGYCGTPTPHPSNIIGRGARLAKATLKRIFDKCSDDRVYVYIFSVTLSGLQCPG